MGWVHGPRETGFVVVGVSGRGIKPSRRTE